MSKFLTGTVFLTVIAAIFHFTMNCFTNFYLVIFTPTTTIANSPVTTTSNNTQR